MSLMKTKKPRKKIRLKEAAEILGCSSQSILTGAVGNFKMVRLNNKKTSPFYVFEADVLAFALKLEE